MTPKTLFKIQAALVGSICVLTFLALEFSWYYSLWYFDIIMHFLGGAWLGLFALWLFPRHSLFKILAFVFLFGFGWEVYELVVDYAVVHDFSHFDLCDTLSDLVCDMAGGMVAFYIVKGSMLREAHTV